jgi:hypothetical protein
MELARVDTVKRRIYLHFEGYFSREKAVALREAYRESIAKVGKGYTVLTYFSNFTAGPEVQEEMSYMVEMANQGGCRRAGRVAGDNSSGQYQVRRLAQKKAVYPHQSFSTVEEAEAYLDG